MKTWESWESQVHPEDVFLIIDIKNLVAQAAVKFPDDDFVFKGVQGHEGQPAVVVTVKDPLTGTGMMSFLREQLPILTENKIVITKDPHLGGVLKVVLRSKEE